MSHSLPPLSSFTRIPEKSVYSPETGVPPLEMLSRYRRNPTMRSSSPQCSSSPPATPYSSRYTIHHPYIRSSSPLGGGVELPPFQRHYNDPPPFWSHQGSHIPISHKDHLLGPISKSEYTYYDEHDFPPSSDLDVEDPPDHITTSLPEMDSETTSESTPGHGSTYFSDSEEEQEADDGDDDGGCGYGNDGFRATFFRMSSERGRWKDDPMALKPNTSAGRRQSMPSLSRTSSEGPSVTARPISEPLEASKPQEAQDDGTKDQALTDNSQELDGLEDVGLASFIQEDSSSRQSSHAPSARDATPDCDPPFEPCSSPLPPSSPPFSPMPICVPSMSRSVSPLSFAPSSPVLMPQSSPSIDGLALDLYELPPHDATLDVTSACEPAEMVIIDDNPLPLPIAEDNEPAPATIKFQSSLTSERVSTSPSAIVPEANPAVAEPELPNQPVISMVDEESQPSAEVTLPAPNPASSSKQRPPSPSENAPSATKSKQEGQADVDSRALRIQDDNGAVLPTESKANPLKRKQAEGSSDRAPAKKQRTAPSGSLISSDAPDAQKSKKTAKAAKLAVKDDIEMAENELPQAGPSNSKGRKKAAGRSRSTQFLHESPQKSSAVDAGAEPIDEEMKGMLIECMATSRASSMAVSVLCRSVLQTHPFLKSQRTEKEWRRVVNRVLHAGAPPRGSGVFGKVDSSGKDDSDRPLEAQWFYVPELDEDQDRAALIRSMMPRPAKRSETKKYKQYYWRPLDKISRWDPEDDL